jgi:hypothetical protein
MRVGGSRAFGFNGDGVGFEFLVQIVVNAEMDRQPNNRARSDGKNLEPEIVENQVAQGHGYLFSNLAATAAALAGSDARRCSHFNIRCGLPGLSSNEDRKARNCSPVTPRTNCPL